MVQILTKEELQQDVADLLDYLHTTPENYWDFDYIKTKIMENMKRFNDNIQFYDAPISTKEYTELIYSKSDLEDLIKSMTNKYVSLGKLELKQEFR